MLVEMYKESGFWYYNDEFNTPMNTGISELGPSPMEAIKDSKSGIKKIVKLKEAGFTADEIIEMSKEKVV